LGKWDLGCKRTYDQLVEFTGVDPRKYEVFKSTCGKLHWVPFVEDDEEGEEMCDPMVGAYSRKKGRRAEMMTLGSQHVAGGSVLLEQMGAGGGGSSGDVHWSWWGLVGLVLLVSMIVLVAAASGKVTVRRDSSDGASDAEDDEITQYLPLFSPTKGGLKVV